MKLKTILALAFLAVAVSAAFLLNRPASTSNDGAVGHGSDGPAVARHEQLDRAATRRATAEEKKRQAALHVAERAAAEEQRLAKNLSAAARWKALPTFVRGVHVDPEGRAWFSARAGDEDPDTAMKRTVEAAAAGGTPVIRGRLLLVDRAKRFWVLPEENSKRSHELLCYDGKSWAEPRLATGEKALPPNVSGGIGGRGEWYECGFEDSVGNIYFLGGSLERTDWGIHRRTPAGEWSFHAYVPPRKSDNLLGRRVQFAELPGGRVLVYPQVRDGSSTEPESRVLRFDGKQQWETIDARACGAEYHGLRFIAPMPDGSIASICDGNRLVFRRPEQNLAVTPEALKKLLDELSAADPKVRERASQALIDHGKHVADALSKLDLANFDPEARIRLQHVRQTIDSGGMHDQPALYGGRYLFQQGYLVARRPDGSLRLYVEHCQDTRDKKEYRECFMTLAPSGEWSLDPIPTVQWQSVGVPPAPQHRFIDSRGGVWLRDALRTEPKDNSAVPVAPVGLSFKAAEAEDKAGRIYVRDDAGGYYVFDPAQPEPKGELAVETFSGGEGQHVAPGERVAWGVKHDTWPNELLCFGRDGGVETLPRDWDDAGIAVVLPLKGPAVVISLRPRNPANEHVPEPWRLWDGKAWHKGGGTLRDFATRHVDKILPLAPQRMEPAQGVGLMADGAGGLWVWQITNWFDPQAQQFVDLNELSYFDGKQWHDVWAAVGMNDAAARKARPLSSAGGGSGLLVHDPRDKALLLVRRGAGGAFAKHSLAQTAAHSLSPAASDFVEAPDGGLWCYVGEPTFSLASLRENRLEPLDKHVRPLLADRDGTVWALAASGTAVRARIGDTWIEQPVAGLSRAPAVMTQSADGRVWLLHGEALSDLRVDRAAGRIAEAGRWEWATPMNDFRAVFCDAQGGLWLAGHGNRHARFQLPPSR